MPNKEIKNWVSIRTVVIKKTLDGSVLGDATKIIKS
jgi:hypothetical protein